MVVFLLSVSSCSEVIRVGLRSLPRLCGNIKEKIMKRLLIHITAMLCVIAFAAPASAGEKTDSAPLASVSVELALGCVVEDGSADWAYAHDPGIYVGIERYYVHDVGIFNAWLLDGPEKGIIHGPEFDVTRDVDPGYELRQGADPQLDFGIGIDDVNTGGVAPWIL